MSERKPKLKIHIVCENSNALQYIIDKVVEILRAEKDVILTVVKDY
jgi:hypothetical protein